MITDPNSYDVRPQRHPLLQLLVAFPIACFACTLATDLAYVWTMNMMWADFSTWLLAVGMAFGVLTALVALILAIAHRNDPARPFSWPLTLGSVVILALALLNNFVHSRDAWTSVVPEGLALSAAIVLCIILTTWLGTPTRTPLRTPTPLYSGARR